MPLIHLPDPSAPLPSEITPPEVYRDRRRFMQAGLALATLPWLAESAQAGLAVQKSPLSTDEPLNKLSDITRYNNFYEFGVDKADPAVNAGSLRTSPWTVRVEGAVQSPRTFDLDALMKLAPMEERVYRLRCVEGWSMVIPWIGFPLAALLKRVQPTAAGKFVEFVTLHDPKQMPGQRQPVLEVSEIIGQLWQANRALGADPKGDRIISNVVMMGMGEPLANFENTVTALRLMLDDNAYGLSRRRVTVSTSGLVPAMDRLGEECPVALAVSLHAPNDRLRDELVPINCKYPLRDLMSACQRYLEKAPRDFVTFEYVMLDGVNDSDTQAYELLELTRKVSCKFNLIPFNPFPGSPYQRSQAVRIKRFAEILIGAGVVTTTRKTRGDDIDAACGQLAGQVQDKTQRSARRTVEFHKVDVR